MCRGENPPGMKFCRSCGSALTPTGAALPAFGAPMAPRPGPTPMPMPGQMPMPGPMGGKVGGPMQGMPSGPLGGVPAFGPLGGVPGMALEPDPTVPPTNMPSPIALGIMPTSLAMPPVSRPQGSTIACPRCGTQTPLGFAYCQQCGLHLQTPAVSEAITNHRPRPPSVSPPMGSLAGGVRLDAPIDPHAGTLAQDDKRPLAQVVRPPSAPAAVAAAWGTAVLVNRDGSDGQRYPLTGEYLTFGRAGADIAFDDDRFLARQHARLERGGDGVVKLAPLDSLNGVFRKTDAPLELVDGTTILIGREVLRYERVDPEESKVHPLVRHGVALFGSPPREPWGRFVQLIPSGGYRDVRHLAGEEIVLGREEGDIVFRDDAFLSRRHAAVTWDGKRALITDLGSSNGTFVRVTAASVLKHADHVRMGDQLLRIELGR
jgi:pSer/pThr/pTyr-binding forkhead associated (FHA) protein